jgi:DNA-directed RNA polymerase specialized sigma24 family protein
VPDDVPDDEEVFFARFGFSFGEGISFLREQANWLVHADDALDLVQEFVVRRLLPWLRRDLREPILSPRGYLRTFLWLFHLDFLRWRGRWPIPTEEDIGGNCDGVEVEFAAIRAWFWDIVDNHLCRECRDVIRLRLDRETFDVLRTWEEVAAELKITRDTASRRFRECMNTIRRMLDDK